MADTVFGIDKGIIRAFLLMVIVIGVLTTFFLSEYVATVLLGSVFYTVSNGTTYVYTVVTGETFTVYNITSVPATELAHDNIRSDLFVIYNGTSGEVFNVANFTIDYAAGNISAAKPIYNDTDLTTNYTYTTESGTTLPITSSANTFLGTAEADFVTTFGYVNTGVKFAAALITVVAVILVFASFLPKKDKGKGKTMGY
jgi:hypothetical protein